MEGLINTIEKVLQTSYSSADQTMFRIYWF